MEINNVRESDNFQEVVIDVWGDYAMFAPAEASAEHVSSPVPTPSAMRNLLSSIYAKPKEFYYQINEIDVIRLGKTVTIMKNEIRSKAARAKILSKKIVDASLYTDKERTQRNYVYLKDVYYRVHATIIKREDCDKSVNVISLTNQFYKRIEKGKCFAQPYLGTRECMAFFSLPDNTLAPVRDTVNFGYMLYDMFDPRTNIPLDTSDKNCKGKLNVMFYQCVMKNGVILVPSVSSEEVKKIA